jgi:N-carbamoylputrescine amidase
MMPNTNDHTKTIKVAAVQVESKPGLIKTNHEHALPHIESAAQAGAQLVILPELFASGYIPNEGTWSAAEPPGGPTVTWLKQISQILGIYVGAGYVETNGKDFFNAYALTTPRGQLAGIVRKTHAEAYCFKSVTGSNVIETALGRLGVGICADNHFAALAQIMQAESIDLMLMPHAWPTPFKVAGLVSEADLFEQREKPKQLAQLYAKLLGVPAILVNQVGPLASMSGIFGKLMTPDIFRLEGRSRIVDSDGTLKGELEDQEGILVAEVNLDPSSRRSCQPKNYGGWLHPGSALLRKTLIPLDETLGRLSYSLSATRRAKAREMGQAVKSSSG